MENELVALLKTHDQKALKKLFDLYHATLCKLAYTLIKDQDLAKDIVQEVFIKLWKGRDKLEITISLQAYLKRATVNTALNYIESGKRLNKDTLDKADTLSHSLNTTYQEITFQELKDKADISIQMLPPRTRVVFTLIRTDEMSYKEVAEALNISTKAVEKEMMKALRLLREALKDYLPSVVLALMVYSF